MRRALARLCRAHTALTEAEIASLVPYETTLQAYADLSRGDMFIDCMDRAGCALVVAQARPQFQGSRYETSVLGMPALRQNEPAVYQAFANGLPVHDIRANTQESKIVSQNVTPLKNKQGAVIAVLIGEHDISRQVRMAEKIEALAAREPSQGPEAEFTPLSLEAREAHHRIKNHLQLMASNCNIRRRAAKTQEEREAWGACASMLMSVSAMQNMLSSADAAAVLRVDVLLETLATGFRQLLPPEQRIQIQVACQQAETTQDKAMGVVIAVNELVNNALKYAFPQEEGNIRIELRRGNRFATVLVTDDGAGLRPGAERGVGLTLVASTVENRLEGELNLSSGPDGTKAAFSFKL